ncbi:MAG: hypothetical protein GVY36_05400 [Verrucomicrobia bacterium]|jgi:hypothetical protein|nr:hypothetical protein [Verrucomicrobiota bacterium]
MPACSKKPSNYSPAEPHKPSTAAPWPTKSDQLKGLRRFKKLGADVTHSYLVYNGERKELSDATTALNFREIHEIL